MLTLQRKGGILAAALGGLAGLSALNTTVARADESNPGAGSSSQEITMSDIPLSPNAKITVERRGAIVLIGINRSYIQNRIDPEAFDELAKAYYDYDHDPSLRAAILFGHGDNFSRGIDVGGFRKLVETGKPWINGEGLIDPLAKRKPGLTKPLIVAVHGDTWNMGHELLLAGTSVLRRPTQTSGRTRTPTAASQQAVQQCGSCAKPAGAMRCDTCSLGITGQLRRPIAWARSRRLRPRQRQRWIEHLRSQTKSRLADRWASNPPWHLRIWPLILQQTTRFQNWIRNSVCSSTPRIFWRGESTGRRSATRLSRELGDHRKR
jgi:Enoyl-CoA hydratase/isomerase